jgi:hypothetical protein
MRLHNVVLNHLYQYNPVGGVSVVGTTMGGFIFTSPSSSGTSIVLDDIYFYCPGTSGYLTTLWNDSGSYIDNCYLGGNCISGGGAISGTLGSGSSSWSTYGGTISTLQATQQGY